MLNRDKLFLYINKNKQNIMNTNWTKLTKTFSVDKDIYTQFRMTCKLLGFNQSKLLTEYMRDFNITHKAELINKIQKINDNNENNRK